MNSSDKISEKVTVELLDRMYGNFVKITDWAIKGLGSKHAMPPNLKKAFEAAETTAELAQSSKEQASLITALQARLADQDARISVLETSVESLRGLTQSLAEANDRLEATVKALAEAAPAAPKAKPKAKPKVEAKPKAEAKSEAVEEAEAEPVFEKVEGDNFKGLLADAPDELQDLGAVETEAEPVQASVTEAQEEESPLEHEAQVTAEAVDAGNLMPECYEALDNEINKMLGM